MRNREKGTLTIFQQSCAEELAKKLCVTSVQSAGVKLEDFGDKETQHWQFRELFGSLMWLAIVTRPEVSDAVQSVLMY